MQGRHQECQQSRRQRGHDGAEIREPGNHDVACEERRVHTPSQQIEATGKMNWRRIQKGDLMWTRFAFRLLFLLLKL